MHGALVRLFGLLFLLMIGSFDVVFAVIHTSSTSILADSFLNTTNWTR